MKKIALLLALTSAHLCGQVIIPSGTGLNITSAAATPSGGTPAFGPGSSTDYALAAWNGTGGNLLRNTGILTDASNNLTVPGAFTLGSAGAFSIKDSSASNRISGTSTQNTYSGLVGGNAQFAHTFTNTTFTGNAVNQGGVTINSTLNQTSTAGFTDLQIARTETAAGSGNQYFVNLLAGASGTTQKFYIKNDGSAHSNAGSFFLDTTNAGAGLYWGSAGAGGSITNTNGIIAYTGAVTSAASNAMQFNNSTFTGGAGINQIGANFAYTINQTSTAGFTNLKISTTETAAGSGTQRLIDTYAGAAGTSSRFYVDNTGLISFSNGSGTGQLSYFSGNVILNATGSSTLLLQTVGATALTIDTSQGATFVSKVVSTSSSAGVGYATGAGGTVTQATSKSTGVTINTVSGQITLNNASLNAGTSVGFTVTNSSVAAKDCIILNIASAATAASYTINVDAVAAGSFRVHLRNESAGALGEALVINYVIIKGA